MKENSIEVQHFNQVTSPRHLKLSDLLKQSFVSTPINTHDSIKKVDREVVKPINNPNQQKKLEKIAICIINLKSGDKKFQ